MSEFVESLETRRLLSTVTLIVAEKALAADLTTLRSDATSSKTDLKADVNAFKADLTALNLKGGLLKSNLESAVSSARTKIEADVSHIIHAGYQTGLNIVADVLDIGVFDVGNTTKIAKAQKKLAADLAALQTVEKPLINLLTTDVNNAVTQVNSAVQAIITAYPGDSALHSDWTTLSNAFTSAKNTLVPELENIVTDLQALSTAT